MCKTLNPKPWKSWNLDVWILWVQVKQSLEVAEITAKKIEIASSAYKPCAERASLLYFILIELVAIDPMYQFSLESYTELFLISVAKSTK